MHTRFRVLWLFLICTCFKTVQAQNFTAPNKIIHWFQDSAFQSIYQASSLEYQQKLGNASSFIHIWIDLTSKYGAYTSHYFTDYEYDSVNKITYYEARLQFKYLSHMVQMYFNAKNELHYIQFRSAYTFYTPPPSVDIAKIKCSHLILGFDSIPLKAELVVPNTNGKSPLALLINEAGSTSRDFDFEPNFPYKDLGLLFGMHGVAMLRYDKRTVEHQFMFVSNAYNHVRYTPEEEYLQDIDRILQQIKKRSDIDTNRIFIVGHGQGGYLAPLILQKHPELKGSVLIGANATSALELMLEQFAYLIQITPTRKAFYEDQQMRTQYVMTHPVNEHTSKDSLPYFVTGEYWEWMKKYDGAATAKAVSQPLCIVQLGRDYQVPMNHFKAWKKILAKKKNAQFRMYPKLNHMMMYGNQELSTYGEYYIKGNIPDTFVADVCQWILSIP